VRVWFIGDIVGSPGRKIVEDRAADLLTQLQIDVAIANGENSAAGFGITPRIAEEILSTGIAVITGGNHIWDRKEIREFMPHEPRLLRPANFPHGATGSGLFVGRSHAGIGFAVLNLQGRTFMLPLDCPFHTAERELALVPPEVKVIIVDFHAEATSEKQAMGWFLDGRVSAVLGTHTHTPTADERVLPEGTAYITDVGMTGPHDSVIGMEKEGIVQKFMDGLPARFTVAEKDIRMNTVLMDIDDQTGRANSIERKVFRIE
jgi:metallophosphoesterase (TIGR00282 family)